MLLNPFGRKRVWIKKCHGKSLEWSVHGCFALSAALQMPDCGRGTKVEFQDAASSLPDKSFDLMVTCMMADCGVQAFCGSTYGHGFGGSKSALGSATVLNGIETRRLRGGANGMFGLGSDAEDT